MEDSKRNLVLEKSIEFAIQVINYCDLLNSTKKSTIAKQLLRAGTAVGANIKEAQQAESRADFIHKIKIAAKEAEESEYWIILCNNADEYPKRLELSQTIRELIRLLSKILKTAITNKNSNA